MPWGMHRGIIERSVEDIVAWRRSHLSSMLVAGPEPGRGVLPEVNMSRIHRPFVRLWSIHPVRVQSAELIAGEVLA